MCERVHFEPLTHLRCLRWRRALAPPFANNFRMLVQSYVCRVGREPRGNFKFTTPRIIPSFEAFHQNDCGNASDLIRATYAAWSNTFGNFWYPLYMKCPSFWKRSLLSHEVLASKFELEQSDWNITEGFWQNKCLRTTQTY